MTVVEARCSGQDYPWLPALEQYCQRVLAFLQIANWELSILICDSAEIADLNRQFRGQNSPTDILSFPQNDDSPTIGPAGSLIIAGDLAISPNEVAQNAAELGISFDEELQRVCVHGILHLLGHDHATNNQTEPMLIEQERILAGLKQERLHIL